MVNQIINQVQAVLKESREDLQVEIVFPVASELVHESSEGILPGAASSEGCSSAGGCATCPFMKMNSLDSLSDLLSMKSENRFPFEVKPPAPGKGLKLLNGDELTALGTTPIRHMREFSRTGSLPQELVSDIRERHATQLVK